MTLELNKIYCMDCLEGLKLIPDNSIDLVLTDPPYGIKRGQQNMFKGYGCAENIEYGECNWDEESPSQECFNEMLRISKNQIIFGANYFTDKLPQSNHWLVWNKTAKGMETNDFSDCELIWTSFKKNNVKRFDYLFAGMLQEDMRKHKKDTRVHPTQKPVELCRWLLEKYSNEGDTVLDPFMGSGTTAVACKQLRRNFIGFELSQKYVDIANKRLQQDTLFDYNVLETEETQ